MKCGVIKFCNHLVKEFEDYDYEIMPLYGKNLHSPIGFHSHAAATNGSVVLWNDTEDDWNQAIKNDLLILLVDRNPYEALEVCMRLKAEGKVVLIGFHENLQAIQHLVDGNLNYIQEFIETLEASGCDALYHSTTKQADLIWKLIAERADVPEEYLPICVSAEMGKDFYVDPKERKGIIIGTRVFNSFLPRNTLLSLVVAAKTGEPTTFVWREQLRFEELNAIKCLFKDPDLLTIVTGEKGRASQVGSYISYPLDCVDWLELLAKHRVCINMDFAMTQGQVPSDCLLVNVPCIGGNGDMQFRASNEYSNDTCDLNQILADCEQMFGIIAYNEECRMLMRKADEKCGFEEQQQTINKIYKKHKEK